MKFLKCIFLIITLSVMSCDRMGSVKNEASDYLPSSTTTTVVDNQPAFDPIGGIFQVVDAVNPLKWLFRETEKPGSFNVDRTHTIIDHHSNGAPKRTETNRIKAKGVQPKDAIKSATLEMSSKGDVKLEIPRPDPTARSTDPTPVEESMGSIVWFAGAAILAGLVIAYWRMGFGLFVSGAGVATMIVVSAVSASYEMIGFALGAVIILLLAGVVIAVYRYMKTDKALKQTTKGIESFKEKVTQNGNGKEWEELRNHLQVSQDEAVKKTIYEVKEKVKQKDKK